MSCPDYIALASGHIFSNKTKRILKASDNGRGYQHVVLRIGNKNVDTYVHRFIAENLIPNPHSLPEVNHINGDKSDNSIENLEWVTSSQNKTHAFDLGLRKEKAILRFSVYGVFIDRFSSVEEVATKFGYCKTHIRNVCNGYKRYAYGYIWRYE